MRTILSAAIGALILAVVPVTVTRKSIRDGKFMIPIARCRRQLTLDSKHARFARTPLRRHCAFRRKISRAGLTKTAACKMEVERGYAEVVAKTGYIYTREAFGDCNFMSNLPNQCLQRRKPGARKQRRLSDGLYEIQVLDSYETKRTRTPGCSRLRTISSLVNPSRPPASGRSTTCFHGRVSIKREN